MKSPLRTQSGPLAEGRTNKREAAVLEFADQLQTVLYDFSVDGGAVGTQLFKVQLPASAVVTRITADVQTAATSGGSATFQVQAGATNLTAATAFDSATAGINAVGVLDIPLNVSAPFDAIKLSSASELALAIAGAALTAGKVRFLVDFKVSK